MTYLEAVNFIKIAGLVDPDLKVTMKHEDGGKFSVSFRRIETTNLTTAFLHLEMIRREIRPGQLMIESLSQTIIRGHVCGA